MRGTSPGTARLWAVPAPPILKQEIFVAKKSPKKKAFLTDVKTLRARARKHLNDGAIGSNYVGDVKKTIAILQSVLATELVCVLRYTQHSIAGSGISSEGVKAEFAEHANDELGHAHAVAERINQLGGTPDFNPEGLLTRSASEYSQGSNLVDMIRENLVAERIAVDHYRELIRYFGNNDPGTKSMLEGILRKEEEHADDMHDLLVAHEGRPMLGKK
jgi:bacterioferritin